MKSHFMRQSIFIIILLVTTVSGFAQFQFKESYPDSLNKKRLYTVVGTELGTYLAGLSYLRYIWYRDAERVPFHWYDDSKGYLQMDPSIVK